jgi:hypothetical protein
MGQQDGGAEGTFDEPISFPSLHTLVLTRARFPLPAFSVPKLERLDMRFITWDFERDLPYFSCFPQSLRFLTLTATIAQTHLNLDQLLTMFPALEDTVFSSDLGFDIEPYLNNVYPSLQQFGLLEVSRSTDPLIDYLAQRARFPGLRRVILSSSAPWRRKSVDDSWASHWKSRLKVSGVDVAIDASRRFG